MPKSIAVSGKGGTGKSTIAALLVEALRLRGEVPVLAIDADPDANLGSLLRLEPEETVADVREDVLKALKSFPAGMTKAQYVEAGLHEVIAEAQGFDLLTMGRSEGSGCYCALNNLIRKFSDSLGPSYRWVVMDNEAGLEHISRQTTRDVDALLVVVTENPLSLHSAREIERITEELDSRIGHRYVVTNMVRPDRQEAIRGRLQELKMDFLVDIPYDARLEEVIFQGGPLGEMNGSPVMDSIRKILDTVGGGNGNT